jgi:spore germination cell wall hydrolase CwlJ-like protein
MSNLALIEKMIQPTLDEQTLDIIIKAKPKDKEILARTIFGEASNQGEEGMTAVGNVILNRYRSNLPKYKTKDFEGIKSVILKPYAFTVYNDKKDENYNRMMSATKENESYAKALDIAEKLLTGKIKDNTGGATHYFNPDEADPYWKDSPLMTPLKKIGNHSFYLEAN